MFLCENYRDSSVEQKKILQYEYDCHIRKKEMSRTQKK